MRFRRLARFSVAILGAVLLGGTVAQAASFPCAKAKGADEKAICADRRLNDMDVELSVRLGIAKRLVAMGTRAALMDDQLSWTKARRACGADRTCLDRRYRDRLEEINGALERVYRKGPF
jgi:uncharacterized protein